MTNDFEGKVYSLKVIGDNCWVDIENNDGSLTEVFGKGEYTWTQMKEHSPGYDAEENYRINVYFSKTW